MLRMRFRLPRGVTASYRYLDLIHDALVNSWTAAGVSVDQVLGAQARPWNFATLGFRRAGRNHVHTLVVSTPDPDLARGLARIGPRDIQHARAATAEVLDFSSAVATVEPDPVPLGEGALGLLMLSPLAIRKQDSSRHWHNNLNDLNLASAINQTLARLSGRPVALQAQPDRLYLRANPDHSVLVPLKELTGGRRVYVIGISAPLVLAGSEDDLRLAWYAGIGEKTRLGFGCLGLAERGIGR
jgi:CRISPR-associated endoribonuclease Cas6